MEELVSFYCAAQVPFPLECMGGCISGFVFSSVTPILKLELFFPTFPPYATFVKFSECFCVDRDLIPPTPHLYIISFQHSVGLERINNVREAGTIQLQEFFPVALSAAIAKARIFFGTK